MKGSKKLIEDKIKDLAMQYAKDVRAVLTGGGPLASAKPSKAKPAKPAKVAPAPAKPAKVVSKAGGQSELYKFIKANPGTRSERMPNLDGKAATLKALLASGHLRCTGRARGTSYYVTKKQLKTV